MEYYLIERQSGGCDYTIGCGIRVSKLKAKTIAEAKEEAAEDIGSSWHGEHEHAINSAGVLEVSRSVDLSAFLDQKKAERVVKRQEAEKIKQKQKDEEEFARLQKKLGK